jgi:hypothetical protein
MAIAKKVGRGGFLWEMSEEVGSSLCEEKMRIQLSSDICMAELDERVVSLDQA